MSALLATSPAHRLLRRVLWADAASCAASGLLQLLATSALVPLLGLPAMLLTGTGLFLIAYAALVGWAASREAPPRGLVWLFVAGNGVWAIDCVVLLVSGQFPVTGLGTAYVVLQAVTVVVLAELQWLGLRRSARA